jgi:hypothetical protein
MASFLDFVFVTISVRVLALTTPAEKETVPKTHVASTALGSGKKESGRKIPLCSETLIRRHPCGPVIIFLPSFRANQVNVFVDYHEVTLTTKLLLKFFESGRESEKYDFLELAEEEEEEEEPVGLVNLGATCYLNSLLQTLFHCVPFRDAIYRYDRHVTDSAEPNIKRSHSVIRELQNVFIRMEQGVANVTS